MASRASQLTESTLVFLDGLGTTEASRDPRMAERFLSQLEGAMERAERALRLEAHWEGVRWQAFSDLLCISLARARPEELRVLALITAQLQADFAMRGVFLRGAMTTGPFSHKKNVAFGHALVRAYDLERKAARHPRVICDEQIVEIALELCNGPDAVVPVARDADGKTLFVDFLQVCGKPGLLAVRDAIETACADLAAARSCGDVSREASADKLRWLVDYFNWRAEPEVPIKMPAGRFVEVSSYRKWRSATP